MFTFCNRRRATKEARLRRRTKRRRLWASLHRLRVNTRIIVLSEDDRIGYYPQTFRFVFTSSSCKRGLSAIQDQEGSPRKRWKFLARKRAKLFAITKVHILERKSAKLIANFSATKVTSLPSLSLSLCISLSHWAYLTHNIGSASALPLISHNDLLGRFFFFSSECEFQMLAPATAVLVVPGCDHHIGLRDLFPPAFGNLQMAQAVSLAFWSQWSRFIPCDACGPKCFWIPSISMKLVLKIDVFELPTTFIDNPKTSIFKTSFMLIDGIQNILVHNQLHHRSAKRQSTTPDNAAVLTRWSLQVSSSPAWSYQCTSLWSRQRRCIVYIQSS